MEQLWFKHLQLKQLQFKVIIWTCITFTVRIPTVVTGTFDPISNKLSLHLHSKLAYLLSVGTKVQKNIYNKNKKKKNFLLFWTTNQLQIENKHFGRKIVIFFSWKKSWKTYSFGAFTKKVKTEANSRLGLCQAMKLGGIRGSVHKALTIVILTTIPFVVNYDCKFKQSTNAVFDNWPYLTKHIISKICFYK